MDKKVKCPRIDVANSLKFMKNMPATTYSFPRLMEKTSLEARKQRNMSWYEDTRTTDRHNAEYLRRLSSLRDNLIDQEQTNLHNAIERLRAKQGRESLHKHKIRQSFEQTDLNSKKLVTTIEKFKQSRPKNFRPELCPLEGKQILEPQMSRTPQLSEKSGSATSLTRSTDDNLVRSNLQRLIAPNIPTSSIPNIGRKSHKSAQQLVLESSPLQRKKSCLSADNADKNPFKHVHKGGHIRKIIRPDLDELDLTPHAIKFEKITDRDKLNIDKLKEYYCIYYLPTNTPTAQDEILSDDEDNQCYEHLLDEQPQENNENCQQTRKDSKVAIENDNRKFPSDEYRYKSGYFGASQRVPERKPMIHPLTGKALVTSTEDIRKHRLRKLHLDSTKNVTNNNEHENNNTDEVKDFKNKKQIIVDMPSIVFNAPTPDVSDVEFRTALLTKAYKQNELRQREIKNLLDDVKELNKRSDDLSEQVPIIRPPI